MTTNYPNLFTADRIHVWCAFGESKLYWKQISGNYLAAFAIVLHILSSPKGTLTVSEDIMLHLQPPELSAFSSNHAPRLFA